MTKKTFTHKSLVHTFTCKSQLLLISCFLAFLNLPKCQKVCSCKCSGLAANLEKKKKNFYPTNVKIINICVNNFPVICPIWICTGLVVCHKSLTSIKWGGVIVIFPSFLLVSNSNFRWIPTWRYYLENLNCLLTQNIPFNIKFLRYWKLKKKKKLLLL